MCLGTGREAKDVGMRTRRGARYACPLSRARGVRKVSATCDGHGVSETDGSLVLPEVLRPAPGEGINARLIVPHVEVLGSFCLKERQKWCKTKVSTFHCLVRVKIGFDGH